MVDAEGVLGPRQQRVETTETGIPGERGRCTLVRPDIDGLLPVYVYDAYEGFEVKRFTELTDAELDRYVMRNVDAMATALRDFQPDAVITGHEVMGPYIAKLACEQTGHAYIAKLHGSALEYAVKQQDRYLSYATEGLGAARRVVGGSRYMLAEASSVIPGWSDRTTVVNPGVDVDLFRSDPSRTPGKTVAYVGKLIAEKGVHNLIAALGATVTEELQVVIVGYGGDEEAMASLAAALAAGDRQEGLAITRSLRHSQDLVEWLEEASEAQLERFAEIPIEFTGRLEHGPLSEVLPTFDVLVVSSVVSEAFGMVAAEAAACGVLPLVPDHSGIAEAGEAIETFLGMEGSLRFDPNDPVTGMAGGIDRLLAIDPAERLAMGQLASSLATQRWSWERVAERLLAAAV